jgi:hypothetical protein
LWTVALHCAANTLLSEVVHQSVVRAWRWSSVVECMPSMYEVSVQFPASKEKNSVVKYQSVK